MYALRLRFRALSGAEMQHPTPPNSIKTTWVVFLCKLHTDNCKLNTEPRALSACIERSRNEAQIRFPVTPIQQ